MYEQLVRRLNQLERASGEAERQGGTNRLAWRNVSANYQATKWDCVICALAVGITITLPPAANQGQMIVVWRNAAGLGGVTVAAQTGEDIEGASSFVLVNNYDAALLIANGGTRWARVI